MKKDLWKANFSEYDHVVIFGVTQMVSIQIDLSIVSLAKSVL